VPKRSAPLVLISASTDDKGAEFVDYSVSLSMSYPLALEAAGAIPWLLPCHADRNLVAEAVRRSDGVLLSGGDDIEPGLYTARLPEQVAKTVHRAHPERDAFELLLIEELLRQRKPLLCICRGHQLVNVALGGTLFADISRQKPRTLNHSRTDKKDRVVHTVECREGTMMAKIAGKDRLGVNSSHHQAVNRLASALQATAVSSDGIVEAMELAPMATGLLPYLLAVQFHPERLFKQHGEHLELFRMFTRACGRNQRRTEQT
jgi:putative glutamine amidotransferase